MSTKRGLFVTIDGPSGIGKSTVVAVLADRLVARGRCVLATKEPTATPLGSLTRFGTDDYQGLALACLVAADRYQHLGQEIRPAMAAGKLVLCDRYIASSLVLQRLDGVAPEYLWQLNAHTDRPDLSVILTGEHGQARERAEQRGLYSRFHRGGTATTAIETALYRTVANELAQAGYDVLVHDIDRQTPEEVARVLCTVILARAGGQAGAI
jgi:dTMP kinase